MKKARYISVLSFAMLFYISATAEVSMTLKTAIERNIIKISAHGAIPDSTKPYTSTGHIGECLEFNVTNLTSTPLKLIVENGRKFTSAEDDKQDLMITNQLIFVLNGRKSSTFRAYAMCISPYKGSPKPLTVFNISKMADGYLLQISGILEKYKFQDPTGQDAVWAIIKNVDSNAVYASNNFEGNILKKFVQFAKEGKKITDDMLLGNNLFGPILNKPEYYITGRITWEMLKKDNATLCVYDEQGNYVTDIFVQEKYEAGKQSYSFKLTTCLIQPDKKYLVRLKVKNSTLEELACVSQKQEY
ncbi:MAG TPA: hypothetical protein PKK00_05790 [Bacteroidales bacterium]|nr:hypothetical protein [Bacteroidales bacterium]HPS16324.1 hypothetical protein [Bacteroidales bacterium]